MRGRRVVPRREDSPPSSRRSLSAGPEPRRRGDRVWRSIVGLAGLMVAAGSIVAACGGGTARTAPSSTHATSTSLPSVQEGAQIFEARCASCHDTRLAEQVTRDLPNSNDEIAVVTNGRTNPLETMPSFGGVLTAAQIRDVVEYTRAQLGK